MKHRRILVLERRLKFIEQRDRISPNAKDYDIAEASALRWALDILNACPQDIEYQLGIKKEL